MSDKSLVLLKLGMGRYPAVETDVPFALLPEVCKRYFDSGTAISHIVGSGLKPEPENPDNAIYIADFNEDDSYLTLLLVRGDPGRAIPGFVNPSLRQVKSADAGEPGYVPGGSSHLVISKKMIASGADSGRHRVALERTRGISRGLARDFLVQLMARFAEEFPERFVAEKKRRRKGGRPEQVQYRPTIKFMSQPNASLEEDLQKGRIGGFRLTRGTANFEGEADEPTVRRMNVQLHAQIAPTEDIGRVRRLVEHIQEALERVSFDSLNLELVDEDGDTLNATQPIPLDNFGESDLRYCKLVSVPPASASDSECDGAIHQPMQKFAIKCLNNESHWK